MFGVGLAVVTAPIWLPVYLAVSTIGLTTEIIIGTVIVVMITT